MTEIREVLRAWLAGAGLRTAAAQAGMDRKTARRYVTAAVAGGLARDGGGVRHPDSGSVLLFVPRCPGHGLRRGSRRRGCARPPRFPGAGGGPPDDVQPEAGAGALWHWCCCLRAIRGALIFNHQRPRLGPSRGPAQLHAKGCSFRGVGEDI